MLECRECHHLLVEAEFSENVRGLSAHSVDSGDCRRTGLWLFAVLLQRTHDRFHGGFLTPQSSESIQSPATNLLILCLRGEQSDDRLLDADELRGTYAIAVAVQLAELLQRLFGTVGITRLNLRFEVVDDWPVQAP